MEPNIIIALIILSATVLLLVIDVVAISCMLALGRTGLLTPQEMFSGFSSNAVIAMLSVMIPGRGIARTGIMDDFSKFIISKAGTRKRNLVGLLSISTGILNSRQMLSSSERPLTKASIPLRKRWLTKLNNNENCQISNPASSVCNSFNICIPEP